MVLSKSSLLKGFQCPKQLYLYKHHYKLMDPVPEARLAIFNTGHMVGALAQNLFPGGVNCSADSAFEYDKCVRKTNEALLAGESILYEAGFISDGIVVIADIVVIRNNKLSVYEVKSSTSVADIHILDAAIQYYVIRNAGFDIKDISVVCINNKYTRQGEIDVNQLFSVQSVKEEVKDLQDEIKKNIAEFKKMLTKKTIPDGDISQQCTSPYDCSFLGYCWKNIPDYSVFNITGLKIEKKFELYNRGIINTRDVPDDFHLSNLQRIQVEADKTNKAYIDEQALEEFLGSVSLPAFFMDFETFNPAVPVFDNSRPYQQIPFQYSVHYLCRNGNLKHSPFLAAAEGDPRPEFIKNLLKVTDGSEDIIVYNSGFEKGRLQELAADFPEYAKDIEERTARIKDLMIPFQKKWYYLPEMQGSYSIKNILPALVPELSYDDMEIADGGTASRVFESLYFENDRERIKTLREDLLKYCELDTLAMVEIYKRLVA